VQLERAGTDAVVTIEDHGHGIEPTVLPNVFRLFYTTRAGASGMGLPFARLVMIGHGGTIDVRSEPGKGTTVTLRLPTQD
jgi:signal transduction histidine kinase